MENSRVKKAVVEQIIGMLENNIICDNGNETFEGWCENGAVFKYSYDNEPEHFYTQCEKLMKEVAPLVDKLTHNHLADF